MAVAYNSLDELLALTPLAGEVDMFTVPGSPRYPWGRVYGGQVAAQGLYAAALTVDPAYVPHSVHAYFIRGGDVDQPILYEVDRIRDGRSFVTRRVVAHQSGGAMLNLSASFQKSEPEQADVVLRSPPANIPSPAECPPVSAEDEWCPYLERRWVPEEHIPNGAAVWMRVAHASGTDPLRQAVALTFMSDDVPTDAASKSHPRRPPPGEWADNVIGASLDHAVWFHRSVPADQWQLHIMDGQGLSNGRGLAFGQVFGADGTHAASMTQEILHREKTNR